MLDSYDFLFDSVDARLNAAVKLRFNDLMDKISIECYQCDQKGSVVFYFKDKKNTGEILYESSIVGPDIHASKDVIFSFYKLLDRAEFKIRYDNDVEKLLEAHSSLQLKCMRLEARLVDEKESNKVLKGFKAQLKKVLDT